MQPVAEAARGEALLGFGVAHAANVTSRLSGLTGDLTSLAFIHAAYAIGARALIEVRGAAWQVLTIEERASASVPLDASVDDGATGDSGDFEVAVSFLPIGGARGLAAGGHFGVKLPNSNETMGIGLNTTDVTLAALLSWGAERWRATGRFGVGILQAPTEPFEQNDVFAYAFEWLWGATPRLRLGLGAQGRASTRGRVPLGTEDLGEIRASGEWRTGRIAVDVGVGHGYTASSGDWTLRAGLSWTIARGGGGGHPASVR